MLKAKGYIRDTLYNDMGEIDFQSNWEENCVCIGLKTLTCGLMAQEASYLGNFWIANGTGDVSWDGNLPTALSTTTQLVAEAARKVVTSIVYLDSGDNVVATPTKTIKFTTTFLNAESIGDIREFGLFGGDATASSNTGLLTDYKTHVKIVKDGSHTLMRELKFDMTTVA